MIEFFDGIEIDDKDLQISELCVIDSYRKISAVMFSLEASCNSRLKVLWKKALDGVNDLDKYQRFEAPTTTQNFEEIKIQQ